MKVFTALVMTEDMDHYVFVFDYKPSRDEVIELVWQKEQAEEFDRYVETTEVFISCTDIIEDTK